MLTTNGADHHANKTPTPAARHASQALSSSVSCTRRQRPAPMDTRSAISRDRVAACAVNRFATFTHVMSSTSVANAASDTSD
jgi:hypothetical protein